MGRTASSVASADQSEETTKKRRRKLSSSSLPQPTAAAAVDSARPKRRQRWCFSLRQILCFADATDVKLLICGTVLALVQAVLPPFVWLANGDFISISIFREGAHMNRSLNITVNGEQLTASNDTQLDQTFDSATTPVFIHMLILSLITFVAAFFQRFAWEVSAVRQVFRAKKAYVRKMLHMDVAWLESRHSGQVASVLQQHTEQMLAGVADHLPMSFFIAVYLLVTCAVCLYIQWDVTLLMLAAFPLLIASRIAFSRWFCRSLEDETRLQAKLTNLVTETLNCISTVISFGAQRQTVCKFERLSAEQTRLVDERVTASSVYDSLAQILLTELLFTAALCYGIWRVGDTQPGRLAALGINMLYMCVTSISIGFHLNGVGAAKRSARAMAAILDEKAKIENERVETTTSQSSAALFRPVKGGDAQKGRIQFHDVWFSYPSRSDVQVLRGVSLTVDAGEHIAIVGPSGSGKSTLTALMLRFYDPQRGRITLDGVDIRDIDPNALRAACGLVSQEPVLFDATIGDNIGYGRLEATQSEINAAAREVGVWSFISTLPDGMQTRVGDRGHQLSGGQKQRVAIARAVLRSPLVMLFDEATSALDAKHEEEVQTAIDLAAHGRSSITIAHRLATIRGCDRVIVLDGGRVVEEGAPDELLAKEGRFWRMVEDERLEQLGAVVASRHSHSMSNLLMPPSDTGYTPVPSALVRKSSAPMSTFASVHNRQEQPTLLDPESARRAWARSSLGARRPLGKSYSVLSQDRSKLAAPVMSKKRSARPEYKYSTNIPDAMPSTPSDVKSLEGDEDTSTRSGGGTTALPGAHRSTVRSVWRVIRDYKDGLIYLGAAIPVTVVRGLFYLLICFELASVLEISLAEKDKVKDKILIVAAVYCALIIVKTMFEAVGRLFIARYGQGLCAHLRTSLFRSILRHGAAYFDESRNSPGRLSHRILHDTASLQKIIGQKVDLLIPAIFCSIFAVTVALIINWKLALLCGFQFPAFFIFRVLELRETTKRQRKMMEEEKKAANLASIVLSNMSTIKAYTLQQHFFNLFVDVLRPLERAMRKQACVSAFVFACQFSFTFILIAITLYFGKIMMINNEVTSFDYLRVVLLTQFGANFFSQLVSSVADLSKARIAADNVLHTLNEKPVDMDNLSDEGLRPVIRGELSIEHVDFRYPSRPIVPVLRDVSLKVSAGQSIALVGPSGSGKSSLLALLQRMYNPTDGRIIVDRHDIRTINPCYLRSQTVTVAQEPVLFSFTIKENITYGMLEEDVTMDAVVDAAKAANIHDFIVSLPQGYDTEVGEFGAQLSGGQKQRVAIARALVRNPKILLLDEATAALDSASEKVVRQAFESKAAKSRTVVHVTHKLASIRSVDRIYVLLDGAIVEQGTHEELVANKALYHEMTNVYA